MEYIIKAGEKEKVMMKIWKKIDKAFFPKQLRSRSNQFPTQIISWNIMEEKDMLSHVNSTFCKKQQSSMMLTEHVYKSILFHQHYEMFLQQR